MLIIKRWIIDDEIKSFSVLYKYGKLTCVIFSSHLISFLFLSISFVILGPFLKGASDIGAS